MRPERVVLLLLTALLALFSVKSAQMSACPIGWTHPDTIATSTAQVSNVVAFTDAPETYQYALWYDFGDCVINYTWRRKLDEHWGEWSSADTIASASPSAFGAAIDSSNSLHVVWANAAGLGPSGETSNLYYRTWHPHSKGETTYNITPSYNVPGDEESLNMDFDDGEWPGGWGTAGTENQDDDGPSGVWSVADGVGQESTSCLVGRRKRTDFTRPTWYLVMPPLLISDGDSAEFSFAYRLDQEGSAKLRLRGLHGFPMQSRLDFTKEGLSERQFVLWEDTLITHTQFETVRVAFPNSLEGKFLHLAFLLYSASDTTVRICIDDLCTSLPETLRPKIPNLPAFCFDPVIAADSGGNVHVAFDRISWQPDACVCRDQIYYLRYDADSSSWCAPVHVDSSGIGNRNYAKARIYRKGSDPAIAVERNMNVHLAWTDVKLMNYTLCTDDVFYTWREGDAATPSWQGYKELSNDCIGQGPDDYCWCFQPDLAVDGTGRLIAVFHGSRKASCEDPGDDYRGAPYTDTMQVWCRIDSAGTGWSDSCTMVSHPKPDTIRVGLDCRCPSVDIDHFGNFYVAYTWSDVIEKGEPEALAVAHHYGRDREWVWPARLIRDQRDAVSVDRSPCVQFDSGGRGYLFWCENDTGGTSGAVMLSESMTEWHSFAGEPPSVVMTVNEFTRGLCPSDDDSLDSDEQRAFEILLTVKDGDGIPLPGFPPEDLYVTVVGDTAGPPDTCFTLADADFGRVDGTYRFWCDSNDTLFATDTTAVEGTWITVKNVSGKARLRLQAHYDTSAVGEEDTVWINSMDQVPDMPDGKVGGAEFSSFSSAYNAWRFDTLESWVWDLQHHDADVCTTGGRERPVFDVDGGDFSWFSTHYPDTLESDACDD